MTAIDQQKFSPEPESKRIVTFIQQTIQTAQAQVGVVAVSGGIDSAVSLTLAVQALGKERVVLVLLPMGPQLMTDAILMTTHLGFVPDQVVTHNIEPLVTALAAQLGVDSSDRVRLGNVQARLRMIVIYDLAKQRQGLVIGTENKSEKYLGYFTRFGDEASDIEPIQHLYKTQVQQLAQYLHLPEPILTKAPSAGLWADQTDEQELGFTYHEADLVLEQMIDHGVTDIESLTHLTGLTTDVVSLIKRRVDSQKFKGQVPYHLT